MEELYKTGEEVSGPITAKITGAIPAWLEGTLYRNGPGKFEFGDTSYNHWFDGMSLLHRFNIKNGQVTYLNQFLKSDAYLRNKAANRIVVSEFGTLAHPDPCKSIFQRFFSYFKIFSIRDMTDNNVVNVYPVGDALYAASETNLLHKVDWDTLDSRGKVDLTNHVAVNSATAHPHIDPDGTVHNLGTCRRNGLSYALIKITPPKNGEEKFAEKVELAATVPCQWKTKPSYCHSFAVTENFYVFLEQPLVINLWKILTAGIRRVTADGAIEWCEDRLTRIHVVDRKTGKKVNPSHQYVCEPLMTFHHVNAYEENGDILMDVCAFKDGNIIHSVTMKRLQSPGVEGVLAQMDWARVRRIRIPLSVQDTEGQAGGHTGEIKCEVKQVSDKGMEFPQTNYKRCNGKKYKYMYGTGYQKTNVDSLQKMDVDTGEVWTWYEEGSYPSEPVFVPHPQEEAEDHGVILSVVLTTGPGRYAYLLVLDAQSFKELARASVNVKIGRDTHGYFKNDNV